jgi:hypothetical protein
MPYICEVFPDSCGPCLRFDDRDSSLVRELSVNLIFVLQGCFSIFRSSSDCYFVLMFAFVGGSGTVDFAVELVGCRTLLHPFTSTQLSAEPT